MCPKKAPGFSFLLQSPLLFIPVWTTRFKHMAAVQPDQIHFCTLHSLKVLRFFRYFGNLRVPSRVKHHVYCTVQYVCSTKKTHPTRDQTNDRFHVSLRFVSRLHKWWINDMSRHHTRVTWHEKMKIKPNNTPRRESGLVWAQLRQASERTEPKRSERRAAKGCEAKMENFSLAKPPD